MTEQEMYQAIRDAKAASDSAEDIISSGQQSAQTYAAAREARAAWQAAYTAYVAAYTKDGPSMAAARAEREARKAQRNADYANSFIGRGLD